MPIINNCGGPGGGGGGSSLSGSIRVPITLSSTWTLDSTNGYSYQTYTITGSDYTGANIAISVQPNGDEVETKTKYDTYMSYGLMLASAVKSTDDTVLTFRVYGEVPTVEVKVDLYIFGATYATRAGTIAELITLGTTWTTSTDGYKYQEYTITGKDYTGATTTLALQPQDDEISTKTLYDTFLSYGLMLASVAKVGDDTKCMFRVYGDTPTVETKVKLIIWGTN